MCANICAALTLGILLSLPFDTVNRAINLFYDQKRGSLHPYIVYMQTTKTGSLSAIGALLADNLHRILSG